MTALRRLLQVVAVAGTLLVGVIALALIASQTPWFKDWLRRYIVRESEQYLNGQLSIGRLGGNLFFGTELTDVVVQMSGEPVISIKNIEVDYSVARLVSSGVVLDAIKLHEPRVVLERQADGWNLGDLVKEQQQEAEREGPGRPISLQSIEVTDGQVIVRGDAGPDAAYRIPEQIRDLDVRASFEYAPVHYSVDIDHLSFTATSPQFTVGKLAGAIAVRDDNLHIEQLELHTGESALRVNGVIEGYMTTPVIKLTTTGNVSLPEIGRIVPAVASYQLHPRFDITANGPAERLTVDLEVETEAGAVDGQVTADVNGPEMGVEGDVAVQNLDLAPILQDPEQRSDITGQATLDLDIAGGPENASVLERMNGSFTFEGPRVVAAGYQATDVRARGSIDGPRINLDARARAYGGTATARGFIVTPGETRPLSLDLRGSADDLDLRRLPASVGAPNVATDLSVAEYQVQGSGDDIQGSARLNRSTVEGATLADGTVATFAVSAREIRYSAAGSIEDLDVQQIGEAFQIAAIAKPDYESQINGTFDVEGTLQRTPAGRKEPDSALAGMTLDATGRLRDSAILGGRLPDLAFETQIAEGRLTGRVEGSFEDFDPERIAGRPDLKGQVTGTVNARVVVDDLEAAITPESITADGLVTLAPSSVGGVEIESATVDAEYANSVADVRTLTLKGPDVSAEASGRLALDTTSQSNLKYRVQATNIPKLAELAGQEGIGGNATIEGTITGNRSSLQTTGTLDGSNLAYQENTALDLDSSYTVTIPDLEFAKARVEAKTTGTFIEAAGLEIRELSAETTYEGQTIEFSTTIQEQTRELFARGEVILHPDHQEVHLPELAIRTEGVEWSTRPGTDATIQYGNNRIELKNVTLVNAEQLLSVNGTIALGGEAPNAALDVVAQNVDIQGVETLLLMDRGLTGRLDAKARVTGTTESPTVDGHVEIRNGGFQDYQYESLVADVDYTGNRVAVDATLTQTPTERITVTGSVPMSLFQASEGEGHVPPGPGEEVDLRIRSTALGLGVVQGFTDQIANVTGTLEADVRVTGSGQDPHLEGYIDIKGGGFGIPLGGVSYTGLDTRIDLQPDVATIRSFRILDEHGEALSVSGQLAVHEKALGAVNIKLESDNFEVIDNELGDVGLDTSITITGELRRPKIEGRVRIEAGRIEVDRLLTLFYDPYATEAMPDVVSAERQVEGSGSAEEATRNALRRAGTTEEAKPATEPKPGEKPEAEAAQEASVFDALEMNLQLVIPDNLVLRGSDIRPGGPTGAALGDINITVGGDINVLKKPGDQVRLVGTVQTIRGTYEFQGRRFDLEREGRIRFVGETEINPILDIRATRVIPNTGVEAQIHITGTAQQPELELSSNPPLEESDILALIVFNRPVNELGTGERSSLAATAGGIATGFIAAPLGESIGRALDLDLFEITTTTEEGDLGAGVTVGQQIGDRAFIKLRQQFGERSTTEFLIEYQLARFLRIQASAAPQTTGSANRITQRRVERAGIDLIFFFSY